MYITSQFVFASVVTGAILAVLLHRTVDWKSCKYPFSILNYDAPDFDSTKKPSHTSGSDDSHAFTEQINHVLQLLNEGKTQLVLPPLDPLVLESVAIGQGPNMLAADLRLSNVTIRGLSKLRVTDAKKDRKKVEISCFFVKLEIEGNYQFDANLMKIPVSVSGPCAFIYENMTMTLAADLKETTKEGKMFYQVENMAVFYDSEKFTINVRNLISGEEAFDSIMNKFLNKNFKQIISEAMSKAHEELYLGIVNLLLSQMPVDNYNQKSTEKE